MNSRLSRPLLAFAISGALLAGNAVIASPASANMGELKLAHKATVLMDPTTEPPLDPTTEPTPDPTVPTTEPTVTEEPSSSPTPSDPVPDPTVTTSDPTPEPSGSTDPTPPVDNTAPTGTFSLNANALWAGQQVVLTQGVITDDVSSEYEITRTVSWGDGTSTTLLPYQAPARKKYTKNGRYTIKLTLTDAAGNVSKASTANAVVAVSTPGKFKLNKKSVWPGQRFKLTISGVPAGTTKLALNWGDGYVDTLKPKNQTIQGYYYKRRNGTKVITGAVTLRVTFTNKNGASSAIWAGKVTVKKDKWKPVVKVKKPSKANRLKSWKYARGTASDKGSGAPYVYVWASRMTSTAAYCFTPKRKWKRVYTQEEYNNCAPIEIKVSKGKWSLKLTGLKKGTLYVDARTYDWGDNASKWSSVMAKITRS